MSLYLSEPEVIDLTGRKYPAYQVSWLLENGWVFHVDANGRPKILRDYAVSRGGQVESKRREPRLRLG